MKANGHLTWKEKKEKIIGNSLSFYNGHHPLQEEVVEMVQALLQKDA
jgi:hypothetical protein